MKTVKRKAEVGERILVVDEVTETEGLDKSIFVVSDRKCSPGFVITEDDYIFRNSEYEVIIEDEPKKSVIPVPEGVDLIAVDDEGNPLPPHSSHYHPGSIDVIRFAEENFSVEERRGFYRMSALKYLTRFDRKGSPLDDLEKAEFYTRKLKELEGAE